MKLFIAPVDLPTIWSQDIPSRHFFILFSRRDSLRAHVLSTGSKMHREDENKLFLVHELHIYFSINELFGPLGHNSCPMYCDRQLVATKSCQKHDSEFVEIKLTFQTTSGPMYYDL